MGKILIVEDNTVFRQMLKEILYARFPRITIREEPDGHQLLPAVDAFRPNIIFMDIRLPGENGLELAQKIKKSHPEIIVVILTSYDLPEYREAAFQYHANHFIAKASVSTRIVDVVESILSGLKEKT